MSSSEPQPVTISFLLLMICYLSAHGLLFILCSGLTVKATVQISTINKSLHTVECRHVFTLLLSVARHYQATYPEPPTKSVLHDVMSKLLEGLKLKNIPILLFVVICLHTNIQCSWKPKILRNLRILFSFSVPSINSARLSIPFLKDSKVPGYLTYLSQLV